MLSFMWSFQVMVGYQEILALCFLFVGPWVNESDLSTPFSGHVTPLFNILLYLPTDPRIWSYFKIKNKRKLSGLFSLISFHSALHSRKLFPVISTGPGLPIPVCVIHTQSPKLFPSLPTPRLIEVTEVTHQVSVKPRKCFKISGLPCSQCNSAVYLSVNFWNLRLVIIIINGD